MKVLHLPFTYHPDAVGGTEVYVAALAQELRSHGIESVIAAPASDTTPESTYAHDGVRVRRYGMTSAPLDLHDQYGFGDAEAARRFAGVLADERPDVVHMHAFTSGVSARVAQAAHRAGVPVVYTYHTPTATCQRGSLLRDGRVICDGTILIGRCASCVLQALGVGCAPSRVLGRVPPSVGALVAGAGVGGRAATALRMPELIAAKRDGFEALIDSVAAVVVVCDWAGDVLLRNGVPRELMAFSRQGVARASADVGCGDARSPARAGKTLRLAFLGRLDPLKGIDVVAAAISSLPGVDVSLDVYGVAQETSGDRYAAALRASVEGDARIRLLPPVPSHDVVGTLAEYDFLVVPSQWMETGPLVVLEAFAAGVPVIGSRLGGVAELVRDGVDGVLVSAYGAPEAWAAALSVLVDDPALRVRLRGGVRPPRTMSDVATDMAALYARIGAGVTTAQRAG